MYRYYSMVDYFDRNEISLLDRIWHSKYNDPERDNLTICEKICMEKQPKLLIVGVLHGDMVRRKKPDPEIYLKAQHSLGISPQECIAFEDSAHVLNSAKNAGIYGVAIPNEFTLNNNFERADLILNSLNEMDDEKIAALLQHQP